VPDRGVGDVVVTATSKMSRGDGGTLSVPWAGGSANRGGGGLRGARGTTTARILVNRARGAVASTGGATNGEGDVKSWYFWWLAPEVQVLIFNGRERIGVPNSLISFV